MAQLRKFHSARGDIDSDHVFLAGWLGWEVLQNYARPNGLCAKVSKGEIVIVFHAYFEGVFVITGQNAERQFVVHGRPFGSVSRKLP
jgi:hypothetical protein